MILSRAQILSLSAVALQHTVESNFEIVDTDTEGGHGLLVTFNYADGVGKLHEARESYRLPAGGGYHLLSARAPNPELGDSSEPL